MLLELVIILMYVAIWLVTVLPVGYASINAASPVSWQVLLIVSLPGVIFGIWRLWRAYATRNEKRERKQVERKISATRAAIAARGGYVDPKRNKLRSELPR